MPDKPVIWIGFMSCPPEMEDEFNKWYNEKHIPVMWKSELLRAVTRYRRFTAPTTKGELAKYAVIYEFKDKESLAAWATGPEITEVRALRKGWAYEGGYEVVATAAYEPIKVFQKIQEHNKMADKPVIWVGFMSCPPEREDEFNKWYNEEHIPVMWKSELLRAVTRYRRFSAPTTKGELAKYLVIYEFTDKESLTKWATGPEIAEARASRKGWKYEGGFEVLDMAAYEPIKVFQK